MASTAGQKTAAQAYAKAVVIPTSQASAIHAFVAMEHFSVVWNGCVITYTRSQRYTVETALKAVISATDRDVVWES